MTITVRLADAIAFPGTDRCLAEWETSVPPEAGDLLVLNGEIYEVEGRIWRDEDELFCSLSRRP